MVEVTVNGRRDEVIVCPQTFFGTVSLLLAGSPVSRIYCRFPITASTGDLGLKVNFFSV